MTPRLEQLLTWLREHNPALEEIDLDEDLLKSRMLDSLQFVNFMLVIEELRGAPIPSELVIPANFATLRIIERTFLA